MNGKPPAVVLKLDSVTGLQAARILHSYNIPVYGFADNRNHFCCRTNSCKEVIEANTSSDELIEALLRHGKELGRKSVIFPCSDDSMNIISIHRNELDQYYHMILPAHDVIQLFTDKVKFYQFAHSNNFPIPNTFFPKNRSDVIEISKTIKFPCIIKPPRTTRQWWNNFSTKLLRISSTQELLENYDKCSNIIDSPIIQEWIEGDDSQLYSCTYYCNKHNDIKITFASRKLRQWPIENGEICLGKEIHNDDIIEITKNMLRGIKFTGVGSLEMKKDSEDQKYYMIETNVCRLPLRFKIVEAGGVELLYTMYLDALDMTEKTNTIQTYKDIKWISLLNDLLASRAYMKKGELTFTQWLKSMRGINTFAVLSLRDPIPFIYSVYNLLLNKFRSIPII